MANIQISDSYPPLIKADIAELERKLGISFPFDYKNFLLAHNGGHPTPDSFSIKGEAEGSKSMIQGFFGIQAGEYDNLFDTMQRYHSRVPANFLPIAYDPGGNLICLSVAGEDMGKVYFWDHEEEAEEGEPPSYDNVYFVADSFNDLLNSLTD